MMLASRPISGSQAFKDGVLLGIDVGTYESKGALVLVDGRLIASMTRSHDLSIPRQHQVPEVQNYQSYGSEPF
jgi:hypothetical protein